LKAVRLTAAAQADIDKASRWYEDQSTGVGDRFLEHVLDTIDRIGDHPEGYRKVIQDVRMATVRRFPFGIWSRIMPDGSIVIACLHSKRDPVLARSGRLASFSFPIPNKKPHGNAYPRHGAC
jgi:plasmid stabilization system protein ParE